MIKSTISIRQSLSLDSPTITVMDSSMAEIAAVLERGSFSEAHTRLTPQPLRSWMSVDSAMAKPLVKGVGRKPPPISNKEQNF